ncbi:hypothetical protein BDF20DRAFT_832975 [Mycotypha africana]|uniref:uncharacterized protein n=1 Tax=Mycotypha africana TaxID=64632 RepID=UPI0022FFEEDC|nr:uncharacterized protein BDF20DRAFT_832975 [Mycotypha africana]KAI8988096.1 hypothetical protein BDF20DRAFT_832975 [Mycotypha africana]
MTEPTTTKKRGRPGRPRKNNSSNTVSNSNFMVAHEEQISFTHNSRDQQEHQVTDVTSNSEQIYHINRFEPLNIIETSTVTNGKNRSDDILSDNIIQEATESSNSSLTPQQQHGQMNSDEASFALEQHIKFDTDTTNTMIPTAKLRLPKVHYEIIKNEDATRSLLLKDDTERDGNEAVHLQQQQAQEEQLLATMQLQQQQQQQNDYDFYNYLYRKKKTNELLFEKPKRHYIHHRPPSDTELYNLIEYDMDEQDFYWLQTYNKEVRRKEKLGDLSPLLFEAIMDKLEKEWFNLIKDIPSRLVAYNQCHHLTNSMRYQDSSLQHSHQKNQTADDDKGSMSSEEDSACAVCDDTEVENSNAIVFCDGCNVAVHQDCYGIPYIPEGQWLCKKCSVLSPEADVSCIFCPNKGGAFKQTTSGDWGHVLCAIWIPEVNVQNPIYMEPIDDVDKIPKSRWKLTCSICRIKQGACIQCDNRHCFTAFHVTCAKSAKLCMRIHTHANQTEGVLLKAYCEKHTPKDYLLSNREDGDQEAGCEDQILHETEDEIVEKTGYSGLQDNNQQRMIHKPTTTYAFGRRNGTGRGSNQKVTAYDRSNNRKQLEQQTSIERDTTEITHNKLIRAFQQHYSRGVPVAPDFILDKINNLECVRSSGIRRRPQVVTDIAHYWSLKRETRKGAPLLKRLQVEPWSTVPRFTPEDILIRHSLLTQLRDDLDDVRYLAEQVQYREQLKLERTQHQQTYLTMILDPLYYVIQPILTKFKNLDQKKKAFWYPVTEKEAPDYHTVIQQPMSFYDIEEKVENHLYTCLDEFKKDMSLIWENCMKYNSKNSSYHKLAMKLKSASVKLFQTADEKLQYVDIINGEENKIWNEAIDQSVFDYQFLKEKKDRRPEEKKEAIKMRKIEKAEEHRRHVQARTEGRKRAKLLRQQQRQQQLETNHSKQQYDGLKDTSSNLTGELASITTAGYPSSKIQPRKLRSRQTKLFEYIQSAKPNDTQNQASSVHHSPPMHQEVQNLEVQQSPPTRAINATSKQNEQNTNTTITITNNARCTTDTGAHKHSSFQPPSPTVLIQQPIGNVLEAPESESLKSASHQQHMENKMDIPHAVSHSPILGNLRVTPSEMNTLNAQVETRQVQQPLENLSSSIEHMPSPSADHTHKSQEGETPTHMTLPKALPSPAFISTNNLEEQSSLRDIPALDIPNAIVPSTTFPIFDASKNTSASAGPATMVTNNGYAKAESSSGGRKRQRSEDDSHTTSSSNPSSTISSPANNTTILFSSSQHTNSTFKGKKSIRRVTRSIGLQASIEELRKRAKISHEAQALVASYNGVSNIEESIEKSKKTYKENRKIHAPLGWVYLKSEDEDEDEDNSEMDISAKNRNNTDMNIGSLSKRNNKRMAEETEGDRGHNEYIDVDRVSDDEQDIAEDDQTKLAKQQQKKRTRGGRNEIPIPNFKRGEIIWAKVNGFPSHPAKFLNYTDEEAGDKLVANRRFNGDILVEFLEVPESHRFGWVGRRTICELGENPEIDKKKLAEALQTKNPKRIQEAKNGYRCAGQILGLTDTESILEAIFNNKQKLKKKKQKRV